jgi:MarR family transcriptional regulator, transcriptional regulator for hemolysin
MKISSFTTYQAGLLQSKAHRTLKEFMVSQLKQYDLTMIRWALLGHIYEHSEKGVKVSELAKLLDVEVSFVTNSLKQLEARKLVIKKLDLSDKRIRIIFITKKASKMVEEIESSLNRDMRAWLGDINRAALLGYMLVLSKIASKSVTG